MFRYIDALFRNCDGPQLRGRENLARVSYILSTPNVASAVVLAPIVHVFWQSRKKSNRGSPYYGAA